MVHWSRSQRPPMFPTITPEDSLSQSHAVHYEALKAKNAIIYSGPDHTGCPEHAG